MPEITVEDTRFWEKQPYVAPNGKLYRDLYFIKKYPLWCYPIDGIEAVEIYPSALAKQPDDAVIMLEPRAEYNYRIDLK